MVDRGATTAKPRRADRGWVEEPPLDPAAVERAYRRHRALRRARVEHRRERRRAGLRFWFVMLLLAAATITLVGFVAQEIKHLFGI